MIKVRGPDNPMTVPPGVRMVLAAGVPPEVNSPVLAQVLYLLKQVPEFSSLAYKVSV